MLFLDEKDFSSLVTGDKLTKLQEKRPSFSRTNDLLSIKTLLVFITEP